jgi:hypothetical protein
MVLEMKDCKKNKTEQGAGNIGRRGKYCVKYLAWSGHIRLDRFTTAAGAQSIYMDGLPQNPS